jgi:hypothetical protein
VKPFGPGPAEPAPAKMKEILIQFLSVLELWRDTQRQGKKALEHFSTALESYAYAKENWRHKEEGLSEYGVDTAFLDVNSFQAQDQASELLRAEQELCILRESMKKFQTCCEDMDKLWGRLQKAPHTFKFVDRLPACIEMYRIECEVFDSPILNCEYIISLHARCS